MMNAGVMKKGLSLVVDYRWPLPEIIHTDPARLRQILVNLVGNAVKFTEQGAVQVTIDCRQDSKASARLRFAVSDSGIGIPAERIDELFQPFMQMDGSASRRYGGTGLGLAISKRLAAALGGEIEVASTLGKGSTFTLAIDAGPLQSLRMLQSPELAAAAEAGSSSAKQCRFCTAACSWRKTCPTFNSCWATSFASSTCKWKSPTTVARHAGWPRSRRLKEAPTT